MAVTVGPAEIEAMARHELVRIRPAAASHPNAGQRYRRLLAADPP
jgi:hypothetical protein